MGVENLVPPGFDPQVFQHVASCYIDYTVPAFPLCNVKYSGSIYLLNLFPYIPFRYIPWK
jgi:hypothetical protein